MAVLELEASEVIMVGPCGATGQQSWQVVTTLGSRVGPVGGRWNPDPTWGGPNIPVVQSREGGGGRNYSS